MRVKVLQLLQAKLICCPAVLRDSNNLVRRYTLLLVLGREVVLALEDNKGQERILCCTHALYNRRLLSIALLNYLQPSSTVATRNYYSSRYYAYYKARLVKVVGVFVENTVLGLHVLYKPKLASYNLRIFAQSSLIVVLSIELDFELWLTLNEGSSLIYSN
jgi:hypothetical protein